MYTRHVVVSTLRRVVHHVKVDIGSSAERFRTPSLGQHSGLDHEGSASFEGGEHGEYGVERSGRVSDEVYGTARKCGLNQLVNKHLSHINTKPRLRSI